MLYATTNNLLRVELHLYIYYRNSKAFENSITFKSRKIMKWNFEFIIFHVFIDSLYILGYMNIIYLEMHAIK